MFEVPPLSWPARAGALLCLGAALSACSGTTETPAPAAAPAAEPAAPVAPAPVAPVTVRVPSTTTKRLAARHILVAWQGAVGALPNVSRSRDEAKARIDEVIAKLNSGADFGDMAKAYSDDATGPRGGELGGFDAGTMVAPFEDAVRALKPGETSGIVETPFGFHVIQRENLREIHVAHLMVSWLGAPNAPAGVTRTHEEARARAAECHDKAVSGATDEAWAAAVKACSDAPLKDDAGDLGWMAPGQMADALDAAAFALDPGAVSAVIETPVGFHVLRRVE